jgi:hypothetical protein
MKNPCKQLKDTVYVKDGIDYRLTEGSVFWKLISDKEEVISPLSLQCPRPERITNWLEQYGYLPK